MPIATESTVLIIGASRGIGFGLAERFVAGGWSVHATYRDPATIEPDSPLGALRLKQGVTQGGGLNLHRFEATDREALTDLVRIFSGGSLDVLIHNAGISGNNTTVEEITAVNVDAPLRVAESFRATLRQSPRARVVLMSSQLGARRGRIGSLGLYGDSKAALNDQFRSREPAWREDGIAGVVMHPGWVQTDMGGPSATLTVDESVSGICKFVAEMSLSDAGRFVTWRGEDHPW